MPPGATTIYGSPVAGFVTPTPVAVSAAATSATLAYVTKGHLSGTLIDDLGPLAGVTVTIQSHNDGSSQTATTNSVGRYDIDLAAGTYDLTFGVVAQHVSPSPLSTAIAVGVGVDVSLSYRRWGAFHGNVTDDANNPIADATVIATLTNGSSFTARTLLDGSFTIRGPPTDIVAGQTYRIAVQPLATYVVPPASTGWTLGDATQPNGAVDVGTIHVTREAQLSGQARDSNGIPLRTVLITVQQGVTTVATTYTDANGNYAIYVPAGASYVIFGGSAPNTVTPAPLAPVSVAPGQVDTGLDLIYPAYVRVSGIITDEFGNPISATVGFSGDALVQGSNALHVNVRVTSVLDGTYAVYLPVAQYTAAGMAAFGFVPPPGLETVGVAYTGCSVNGTPTDCSAINWTYTRGILTGSVTDDTGRRCRS